MLHNTNIALSSNPCHRRRLYQPFYGLCYSVSASDVIAIVAKKLIKQKRFINSLWFQKKDYSFYMIVFTSCKHLQHILFLVIQLQLNPFRTISVATMISAIVFHLSASTSCVRKIRYSSKVVTGVTYTYFILTNSKTLFEIRL